jgi:predicted ATPase/DNA-binding winged helix-turn-helix (wHTH) protein
MPVDCTFAFGPFRLFPVRRTLLEDDKPVRLGSRALDLLVELVTHAGQIISKEELIARVWPEVFVDEGSLRVHISALRRALGDDRAQHRYILNIPNRGYSFIAEVASSAAEGTAYALSDEYQYDLPVALTRMIGRSDIVASLIADMPSRRFITIVGPGGIGKTRVAVAVAEAIAPSYLDGARFVDLSPVGDVQLVPSVVASALAVPNFSSEPASDIMAFVHDKHLLLVLDSCEHVLEEVAALAQRILQHAPGVHILATSREPLKIPGERVRRLPTLAAPPTSPEISAKTAQTFPAVELFVERVAAVMDSFSLNDVDAPVAAQICQKLDGIPLAIELVAGRAETFGIHGLARMLEDGFELFAEGGGVTIPRHRTMNDTLEWSYKWLSEAERAVLCRLGIFAGSFSLDAARAIVADVETRAPAVAERLASLVGKSLVTADAVGTDIAYRLLDTTRAYALERLAKSGALNATARRHAVYFRSYFEQMVRETTAIDVTIAQRNLVANLRAALKWAFSGNGDTRIGAKLAAASALFLIQVRLVSESSVWTGQAIAVLDDTMQGGRLEMELQSRYGFAVLYTAKSIDGALAALSRGRDIGHGLAEPHCDWMVLWGDIFLLTREGDLRTALAHALEHEALTKGMVGSTSLTLMDMMVGNLHHLLGDQVRARLRFRAVLERLHASQTGDRTRTDIETGPNALATLAKIYWLEGYADKALATAWQAIDDGRSTGSPLTHSSALLWAMPIFVWARDLDSAQKIVDSLIAVAERHALAWTGIQGRVWRAKLSILNGDIDAGVSVLRALAGPESAERDQSRKRVYVSALATGLARQGRADEALTTLDTVLAEIEGHGGSMYLPEILRTKGDILTSAGASNAPEAEVCLRQSLECARRQSALAFELQAALSLGRLWAAQGKTHEARVLIEPIYRRFTEGFETADLMETRSLLKQLCMTSDSIEYDIVDSQIL